jgi:hypothetical protein
VKFNTAVLFFSFSSDHMIALSNFYYVFIVVSTMNAVASLQRIGRVWLVFQRPREPPQHRQGEILTLKHKTIFLLVTSGQILASIGTTATFLVLTLLKGGHWTIMFSMSTVTVSIVGQVCYRQIPRQNAAYTSSVLGWPVNGIPNKMAVSCS